MNAKRRNALRVAVRSSRKNKLSCDIISAFKMKYFSPGFQVLIVLACFGIFAIIRMYLRREQYDENGFYIPGKNISLIYLVALFFVGSVWRIIVEPYLRKHVHKRNLTHP